MKELRNLQALATNFGMRVKLVEMIGLPTNKDLENWTVWSAFTTRTMSDTTKVYLNAPKPAMLNTPRLPVLYGPPKPGVNVYKPKPALTSPRTFALQVFTILIAEMSMMSNLEGVRQQSQLST